MIKSNEGRIHKILFIIGIIGIIDTIVVVILRSGLNLGTFLPGLIGGAILLYIYLKSTDFYKRNTRIINRIEKVVLVLFIVWLISFILMFGVIYKSSLSDKNEKTNCILVLGAGLRGNKPSLVLTERLNLAVEYIKQNPDTPVIVSGGKGVGEDVTEAEAMKIYLTDRGINGNSILEEERSTSTIENLKFSKKIYESYNGLKLKKIMIITSDFHMFRSKFLAQRIGIKAYGMCSKTPFYIYPNVIIREYFAVIKSFFLDK